MSNRAAIRYAKAVLQQANENNSQSLLFGDMQSVHQTIANSRDLRAVLASPVIKPADKQKALLGVFSSQNELTKTLIRVLVKNQRIGLLDQVATSYVNLYNEAQGVKVAKVTTAVALTPELESKILAKVTDMTGSTNVTIENTIDESIIGGFILRVGDLQYNASIADKLNRLKREFTLN
ncbi:MAG: ATP synthase F1 subunit delta [Flavobacteriaceae bacterium]|nr:ATP synthase F1 subunit delta [Flavobacteriaceae bacterium]